MAKEDEILPVKMGNLEIESFKKIDVMNNNIHVSKLTQLKGKSIFSRKFMTNDCSCNSSRNNKNITISKKKNNQCILKEPVLKLLRRYSRKEERTQNTTGKTNVTFDKRVSPDITSLCALVDNCNQLRISSGTREQVSGSSNEVQWWKKKVPLSRNSLAQSTEKNQPSPSCSQQALNPPCDVTIDELASYFETLVHIPKKMSSMAEMMYI